MGQMAMAGLSAPLAWPLATAAPEGAAVPAAPGDHEAPAGPGVAAAPAGGGDVAPPERGTRAGVTDFSQALASLLGVSVVPAAPASLGAGVLSAVPALPGAGVAPSVPALAGAGVPAGVASPSGVHTWRGVPVPLGGPALADGPSGAGLPFPPGPGAAVGLPEPPGLSGAAGGPAPCGPAGAAGPGGASAPGRAGGPGCGGAPCGDACEPPFSVAAGLPASGRWPPGGGGDLLLSVPGDPVLARIPGDGGGCAASGVRAATAGGDRAAGGVRVRITAFAPAAGPSLGPGTCSPDGTGPGVRAADGGSADAPGSGTAPSAAAPGETTREQVPVAGPLPAGGDATAAAAGGEGGSGPAGAEAAAGEGPGPVGEAGPQRRQGVDGREADGAAREARGEAGAGVLTAGAPRTDGAAAAHAGGERTVIRDLGAGPYPGLEPGRHWPGHRPAEVEVEVDAGDLGQLTVRVAERHGTVAARFLVEGSTVSHLLQRNMPELQARLEQAGLVPGQLEVSLGGSGDRGRRGFPGRGQEPLRVVGTEPVFHPSPARGVSARTGAVVARAGTGRGVLDVFM